MHVSTAGRTGFSYPGIKRCNVSASLPRHRYLHDFAFTTSGPPSESICRPDLQAIDPRPRRLFDSLFVLFPYRSAGRAARRSVAVSNGESSIDKICFGHRRSHWIETTISAGVPFLRPPRSFKPMRDAGKPVTFWMARSRVIALSSRNIERRRS